MAKTNSIDNILGVATATSLAFNPTTNGMVGTATNNNASAGYVGEVISSVILSGSAISLTTSTYTNLTSISLTAGDWDVWGSVRFTPSVTGTVAYAGISTTSVTSPNDAYNTAFSATGGSTWSYFGAAVPQQRLSLSGTTTVYMVVYSTFTGTATCCGALIARRAR